MVPKVLGHFATVLPRKLFIGCFSQGVSPIEKFMARIKLTLLGVEEMVSFVHPFARNSGKLCSNGPKPITKSPIYGITARLLRDFLLKEDLVFL